MKATDNVKINKVQNVFSEGSNNCIHSWIYDAPTSVYFTSPMICVQDRICERCGRIERLGIDGRQARFSSEKFESIKAKFSK